MNKKKITFVTALTIAVTITLVSFIGYTITDVKYQTRQYCFNELEDATEDLAKYFYETINSDHIMLSAIAENIAHHETLTDEELLKIMNSYNFNASYIFYLQILKPDGTMLYVDGEVRDASAYFNFATEAQGGKYISPMQQSTRNPKVNVVRHVVPIERNGKIVYILYGTITLTDLAKKYTTNLYGGQCYVYIVDGNNGDFILDSWHKTQGNFIEIGERKIIDNNKSLADVMKDMRNGVNGETAFISRTTGNVLYMRYAPIGINNWNVLLTVEEKHALARSEYISQRLYRMAAVIGAVLLFYIVCVAGCIYSAYRYARKIGTKDQSTGLQNRNMYLLYLEKNQDTVFDLITCVYVDVNGLHKMNNEKGHAAGDHLLIYVAGVLLEYFDYHALYRIGGDEFVVFSKKDDKYACAEKMRHIMEKLGEKGYSISFGIVSRQAESGLDRVSREADDKMLKNKSAYYVHHNRRRN